MGPLPKEKKKNVPKSIRDMSKEMLQETLRKKKECNVKAHATVETMCETGIDEEWFLDNLQFINQSHFDDVTIERSILKLCGYPLCDNPLKKISPQQYHISLKYNKVFDITERKNFCSSLCYKAAMFVKNQLFTSPLWFRDQETIPKYSLIHSSKAEGNNDLFVTDTMKADIDESKADKSSCKRKCSTEIIEKLNEQIAYFSMKEKHKLSQNKSNNQQNNDSLDFDSKKKNIVLSNAGIFIDVKDIAAIKNKSSGHDLNAKKAKSLLNFKGVNTLNKNSMHNVLVEENQPKKHNNLCKAKEVISETKVMKSFVDTNIENSKKVVKLKSRNSQEYVQQIRGIKKVEISLLEWFSLDTLFYLNSEKKIKELFKDKTDSLKQYINSKLSNSSSTSNDKLEKMIRLYGLLEANSYNNETVKKNFKPLPDYSALQEEGKNLDIKVRAFYKGQLEVKESLKKVDHTNNEKEETEENRETYMPLIDSHAQNALRRNIILNKLNKLLPDLLRIFSRDYLLPLSEIRDLVTTFNLRPHNITFKPLEWHLIGIIILHLLSLKNKHLNVIFSLDSTQNQLKSMLQTFALEPDYFKNLVAKLLDAKSIVENIK